MRYFNKPDDFLQYCDSLDAGCECRDCGNVTMPYADHIPRYIEGQGINHLGEFICQRKPVCKECYLRREKVFKADVVRALCEYEFEDETSWEKNSIKLFDGFYRIAAEYHNQLGDELE